MSIGILYNRTLIAIDAYLRRYKRTSTRNKTVLIIFQQVFGDSVLIQPALEEFTKIYPKGQGYTVKFLVRPSVLAFMKDNLPLPQDMVFEEVDFKRYLEDFSYYKEIRDRYTDVAEISIITGRSLSALIFSTSNNAIRKIGVDGEYRLTRPLPMAIFNRTAYTERVISSKEDMVLRTHEKLLHYLGDTGYTAKLPTLLRKNKVVPEDKYCVICPGASETAKCWPIERFAQVADYIVDHHHMNVHLCGGAAETQYADHLLELVENKGDIISHIGNTNFSDWSAIIQHATIVIGNDSATLHIAAAARVKALCINGDYEENIFFPYFTAQESEQDRLPACIQWHMDCAWCRERTYFYGSGNQQCMQRIKEGKCATCIDVITVDEVINKIDELMRPNELV